MMGRVPAVGATTRMWLVGLVLLVSVLVVGSRLQVWSTADRAPFGRMSEQWLADYRSTHST